MKFINGYIKSIDNLSESLGKIISWATILLVIVVCIDVFTRYFMQTSSAAVQELEWHLFSLIFLMGASYTLKNEGHVRVDVIYGKFSEKKKAWINFIGTIIFLIPFCLLIIYSSKNFVLNSFAIGETSPDSGGLPARYILKAVLPVSFLFILLQGISLMLKSLLTLLNRTGNNR